MGSVPFSFPLSAPLLNLHPLSSFMLSPGPFRPRGVDQGREWKGEEGAGQMWFGALSCPPFLDRWRLQRCLSKMNKPQQFEITRRKWACRSICKLCFKTTWQNRSRVVSILFPRQRKTVPLGQCHTVGKWVRTGKQVLTRGRALNQYTMFRYHYGEVSTGWCSIFL